MPPSLPPEIWIHVSKFMPQKDLCDLLRVNSTFFQLAMQARYRDVSFMWFDDAAMRKMRRLRDPAVARWVRNLHVNPWFSQEAVTQYMRSRFFTTHRAAYHTSLKEVIQAMVDTVAHLTAVASFSVEWVDLPSPERLRPFLAAAWRAFGPRVQRVALKTAPGNLRALLSTAAGELAALTSLHVELVDGGGSAADHPGADALVAHLAPFIGRAAPTLRSLSLAAGETRETELAPLFCALGHVPNLERLDLAEDRPACGLSAPRGLARVLCDHAPTLRHVRWTMGRGAAKSDDEDEDDAAVPPSSARHDDPYTEWLAHVQAEPCVLANLTTLELALPRSARGRELLVACLRRSAATLASLVLAGPHLAFHEACAVASAFVPLAAADAAAARNAEGCRLEALRMPVQVLSVDLLAHLAQALPTLDRLSLDVKDVRGSSSSSSSSSQRDMERSRRRLHDDVSAGDGSSMPDFVARLREQEDVLLSTWSLRDISISGGPAGRRKWWDLGLMRAIAEAIPSVQRCCGIDRRDLLVAR